MSLPTLLSSLPAPASNLARHVRVARVGVATASALGAAVLWQSWGDAHLPTALWIPTGLLCLSALLLHHREVGSQLIARAGWWANLVLGALLALASGGNEQRIGVALVLTTGTALLVMGRLGLDEREGSAFRPVAFRTTLTIGMIMAVADAEALALFGALKLQPGGWKDGAAGQALEATLLFGSAAVLVAAIAGLYRLRVWGLLLGTSCAGAVAGLALVNAYGLPSPLGVGLAATSTIQVLLPLPILVAIIRGRAAPATAPSRLGGVAPAVLVGLLMAASAGSLVLGSPFR